MRHALDADHLAAVATMASRRGGVRSAAWRGAVWGLGHTLTLFVVGGVCLLQGAELPARFEWTAELVVGAMLIFLGAEVFWRMRRQGVHLHAHGHDDGTVHIHAHAHPTDQTGHADHDDHEHRDRFPRRALVVGLVHGTAGSAALLLLTLHATGSVWLGLAYIAVFGVGSILGMAVLSGVLAIPLHASTPLLDRLHRALHTAVGAFSLLLGVWIVYQAALGA